MTAWQIWTLVALGVLLVGGAVFAHFNEALVEWLMIGGLSIGFAGLLVIAIPAWNRDHNQWQAWCRDHGGHVADHTDTTVVTTVSGNGQPGVGVGSSTTYYCLSADGRVLDVR